MQTLATIQRNVRRIQNGEHRGKITIQEKANVLCLLEYANFVSLQFYPITLLLINIFQGVLVIYMLTSTVTGTSLDKRAQQDYQEEQQNRPPTTTTLACDHLCGGLHDKHLFHRRLLTLVMEILCLHKTLGHIKFNL